MCKECNKLRGVEPEFIVLDEGFDIGESDTQQEYKDLEQDFYNARDNEFENIGGAQHYE